MKASIPAGGPREYQADIRALSEAAIDLGLGYLPIHFRMATQDDLAEIASFGLPNRFQHWYFGGIFKSLQVQQEQELFKILELVLNTDPIYAFLLDTNTRLENLTVIAHVLGHVDFFVENCWFARSDKDILNRCERHARSIRHLRKSHGKDLVDDWITAALTLATSSVTAFERDPAKRRNLPFYFFLEKLEEKAQDDLESPSSARYRILEMMRHEQEYFDLISRTQIMNEGWASFVECKLLESFLPPGNWAKFSLNFAKRPAPYLIGSTLYQHLFRQRGWKGVFEIRKYYEDVAFIDEFLTQEISRELDLFVLDREKQTRDYDIQKVKAKILEEKLTRNAPVLEALGLDPSQRAQLRCTDPSRTLDRTRVEVFLKECTRLWPDGVVLEDVENRYVLDPEGFRREKL